MTRSPSVTALAGIDTRALAALRVGLAMILLWDQCIALSSVRMFYSDDGILPRARLLQEGLENPYLWSLHLVGGSVAFQIIMLGAAMLAALAMLVGWRTRWATAVSWVLLCSIQARNPFVLFGGDVVLRMLLFWSLFLPLGARASMDAASRERSADEPCVWVSMASLALLLQVAFIYWFTALLKYGNEWTRDGTALYYVLNAEQFVHGFGLWLRGWPETCRVLTLSVIWLELLGPFIAFIPLGTRWWRLLVVPCMWGLHIGIALCMALGMFPWIMVVAWLPFLPPVFWDWFQTSCSSCKSCLKSLLRACGRGRDQAIGESADPADLRRSDPSIPDPIALDERSELGQINHLRKSAESADSPSASLKHNSNAAPASPPFAAWQQHWLVQSAVAACLAIVFCWCLSSVEPPRFIAAIPPWIRPVAYALRLDQFWGLFAPTPIKNDGWLVLEAELYDHTRIDLLRHGQPLSFEKPANQSAEYPDWKWQKLEANLTEDSCKSHRVPFGNYIARQWSKQQPDSSKKVRGWVLYNMLEVTLPHYHAISPQKQELGRNDLFIE